MTHEDKRVACHICRKEIPEAAALHAETKDYILHFCEVGCLALWQKDGQLDPTSGPAAVDSKKKET